MIDANVDANPDLNLDPEPTLWREWFDEARGDAVDGVIRGIYAEVGAEIAAKGATCWSSGKCCHFESYGHRLYVTGLEIAWVVAGLGDRAKEVAKDVMSVDRGACALQIDGLCSVHTIRPLGCRVFFCQEGTDAWQQALYEQFQGLVKSLHTANGLPYRYMEWRDGLRWALDAARQVEVDAEAESGAEAESEAEVEGGSANASRSSG